MINNLVSLCLLLLISLNGFSQNKQAAQEKGVKYIRCFTAESEAERKANNPNVPTTAEFEKWMAKKLQEKKEAGDTRRVSYTIPYIVHVIHDGENVGSGDNIAAAQINAQIQQINDDFQRNNIDAGNTPAAFLNVAGSIDLNFKPALVDESGNLLAEPGINRIDRNDKGWTAPPYGECSDEGAFNRAYIEVVVKPQSGWDPTEYFNIWLMDIPCGILGYAQFPSNSGLVGLDVNEGASFTDGVVFLGSSVGSLSRPGSTAPYNLGRTATHEIGHWLGLRHIWGDGNGCSSGSAPDNCACGNDDFCDDTPNAGKANYSCVSVSSCGTSDMKENYMDYTADACMNIFTEDQIDRIETVLENSPRRFDLLSSNVWELPSNALVADFSFSSDGDCTPVGGDFIDESVAGSGVGAINSWVWNFDKDNIGGASPSTFSGQNPPTVQFSNVGLYKVELIVSNGTQSDTAITLIEIQGGSFSVDNLNDGTFTIYSVSGQGNWGYIGGHNNYEDKAKADYFDDLGDGTTLNTADFFFHKAVGNPNSPVKFNVYSNSGNQPGSIISTTTLTIGDLVEGDWTTVDFPDIEINGPVYIGYELVYIAGDTLSLITNLDGETTPATAWEQFNTNDWFRFDAGNSWGSSVALGIRANVSCPVVESAPVADFEADDVSVCSGVEVNFTDLSSNIPTSWAWDFGDGNTSTAQNPTHIYALGGNYEVSLTATNDLGDDTETKTDYISVETQPDNFQAIASSTEICANQSVDLSMSGTFSAAYSWEENGQVIATEPNTIVNPLETTTYKAVCDNGTCRVTDEITITVNALPEAPTITSNVLILTANSSAAVAWQWSNETGEIAGATDETYSISEGGIYSVKITDANGCSNVSADFEISLSPPSADFSADDINICVNEPVQFTDESTNVPTSWSWDFGDGNTSTMESPVHTYDSVGIYTVELVVINDFGENTATKTNYIVVNEAPDAPEITQDGFDLAATGTGSFQWFLDDVAINGATNNTYTASEDGTYTATVTSGAGCVSPLSNSLTISNTSVIDAVLDAALTIYPNPVNTILNIRITANNLGDLNISIMDIKGSLIYNEYVTDLNTSIDMSGYARGIYLVKILSNEGKFTVRQLVKN